MATSFLYKVNYSTYIELSKNGEIVVVIHRSFYTKLPNQFIIQLFEENKNILSQALGYNYNVTSFEREDKGDNNFSIQILLETSGKRLFVQVYHFEEIQYVEISLKK